MSMKPEKDKKMPQDIINESGYPLQIHLENQINSTHDKHHWSVLVHEHRWIHPNTEEESFVDLILQHDSLTLRLVIECKRINGTWTFLLPDRRYDEVLRARTLISHHEQSAFPIMWGEYLFNPESCESAFCVMETGGRKDSRTLEDLSDLLLLSVESIALQERSLRWKLPQGWTTRLYLPLVVTTAKLQKAIFLPSDVSVEDGEISRREIGEVKMIRFRKIFQWK